MARHLAGLSDDAKRALEELQRLEAAKAKALVSGTPEELAAINEEMARLFRLTDPEVMDEAITALEQAPYVPPIGASLEGGAPDPASAAPPRAPTPDPLRVSGFDPASPLRLQVEQFADPAISEYGSNLPPLDGDLLPPEAPHVPTDIEGDIIKLNAMLSDGEMTPAEEAAILFPSEPRRGRGSPAGDIPQGITAGRTRYGEDQPAPVPAPAPAPASPSLLPMPPAGTPPLSFGPDVPAGPRTPGELAVFTRDSYGVPITAEPGDIDRATTTLQAGDDVRGGARIDRSGRPVTEEGGVGDVGTGGFLENARNKVSRFLGQDREGMDSLGQALLAFGSGVLTGGPDLGAAIGAGFAKAGDQYVATKKSQQEAGLNELRIQQAEDDLRMRREKFDQWRKDVAAKRTGLPEEDETQTRLDQLLALRNSGVVAGMPPLSPLEAYLLGGTPKAGDTSLLGGL